uniref:Uncharacterized protein n=1 Tax=Romanomermis culicivorax TaxID=13658 RepID=A0A915JDD0_ROMCU
MTVTAKAQKDLFRSERFPTSQIIQRRKTNTTMFTIKSLFVITKKHATICSLLPAVRLPRSFRLTINRALNKLVWSINRDVAGSRKRSAHLALIKTVQHNGSQWAFGKDSPAGFEIILTTKKLGFNGFTKVENIPTSQVRENRDVEIISSSDNDAELQDRYFFQIDFNVQMMKKQKMCQRYHSSRSATSWDSTQIAEYTKIEIGNDSVHVSTRKRKVPRDLKDHIDVEFSSVVYRTVNLRVYSTNF